MIDSGSDTVTVHGDVIRELRLPIKGAVRQEVAGGKILEKPLYSAYLGIGEKTLDIEVTTLTFPVYRLCLLYKLFHKNSLTWAILVSIRIKRKQQLQTFARTA